MAKQKSSKPAAAAKKTAKRTSTARKAARKATAKTARKAAVKTARKAAPKGRKTATRPASKPAAQARPKSSKPAAPRVQVKTEVPSLEQVETTSAGIQPLAPEHAAVDELTSSGNELLDIFQRYDRNRTGYIEAAEFARLLEALGQNVTEEELMIAIDVVDVYRTGKISWREFKNWWTSR